MKPCKNIILSLFLFLSISSCSNLKQLADAQKPTVSVNDFRVSGISLSDIELTFDLKVDNPNPVSLSLANYDYELKIGSDSFIQGNQSISTVIEANGSNIISVPVSFTFKDLYGTYQSMQSEDESEYTFLANLGIDVPFLGMVEVPIEKTGVFPVVKAPSISISKFSLDKLSFTKADVELELTIDNPNNFGLIMNSLIYEVELNGFNTITGNQNIPVSINEGESQSITIPASFNFLELGAAAYSAFTSNDPFNYSLNGTADVGATLPFFESSSFNFDRSGMLNILK